MKNILKTGGTGFIGSHLVKYFVKKYKNYNIINLDKLTYVSNISFLDEIKNFENYCFIDISKIKNELDWNPKTSIGLGLQKTINWYLND